MEALQKELTKLEQLTEYDGTGKSAPLSESINGLVDYFQSIKAAGGAVDRSQVFRTIELNKKAIDDRQKEIYTSMARLGKALDKKFPVPLPSYPGVFSSEESQLALDKTVVLHLLRTGQFGAADTLLHETNVTIPEDLRLQFQDLHRILEALERQDIVPALSWAREHHNLLQARSSPLEFHLHRSQYIRLLLYSDPPDVQQAIAYAHMSLTPFFRDHEADFKRLMACIVYLPLSRLKTSPYADLTLENLHSDLGPLFAKEFCATLGISKQIPLAVVTGIGGSGALAKIEKGRRIIRDSKSEWSQSDELPIEISVPSENRYHSIFTCPVSKEHSTHDNPPMMLTCGHVIAQDSLHKISKPVGTTGRVKCPYCPNESSLGSAIQVYF